MTSSTISCVGTLVDSHRLVELANCDHERALTQIVEMQTSSNLVQRNADPDLSNGLRTAERVSSRGIDLRSDHADER